MRNLDAVARNQVGEILARLERDATRWLREEGIEEGRSHVQHEADLRYFRQGYELPLEIDPGRLPGGGLEDLAMRFGAAHERLYGFRLDHPVELVNLRAVATGTVEKVHMQKFEPEGPDPKPALIEQQPVYFSGHPMTANVYDRDRLRAGNRIRGPAIVVQMDSTCVIHPGHVGAVDPYLNILITPEHG